MPQYEVGHLERLSRIEDALSRTPGVFLTGSGYRGVGIADCVRHARETARRVIGYLDREERPEGAPNGVQQEAISWTT
jgi:oxygen-dependent protoporphyrinogen oxidase